MWFSRSGLTLQLMWLTQVVVVEVVDEICGTRNHHLVSLAPWLVCRRASAAILVASMLATHKLEASTENAACQRNSTTISSRARVTSNALAVAAGDTFGHVQANILAASPAAAVPQRNKKKTKKRKQRKMKQCIRYTPTATRKIPPGRTISSQSFSFFVIWWNNDSTQNFKMLETKNQKQNKKKHTLLQKAIDTPPLSTCSSGSRRMFNSSVLSLTSDQ